MKIVIFLRKNVDHPKWVVDFLREKTHSENHYGNRRGFIEKKLQQQRHPMEIVQYFACEAKKPEKSSGDFLHYWVHSLRAPA